MEPIFKDMTKNVMKGFKFLAIQIWKQYIDFKKTKGKNASTCLKEQKEKTHEPPSSEIGEVEEVAHEQDQNLLPSDFEKCEETSHKYEEVFIENIEDHFETHSTLDMKQRASTYGCLNYKGVPTDGCSQFYVGDIEITFEELLQSKLTLNMKIKTLQQLKKKQDQLPHHDLSFMKLVQPRRKKMRRFICKSLIFLNFINMNENKI